MDVDPNLLKVARDAAATLVAAVDRMTQEPARWHFPIGSDRFPPPAWYVACVHDMTGAKNRLHGKPYPHTGIDLNVEVWPRGDIDRGQPVFAVTDGVVHRLGYSKTYLGSVIILVGHECAPLYVRYWHLARDAFFNALTEGQLIKGGDCLGSIGNYKLGGDHCHFDMALDPFESHWWFTRHGQIAWIDPVPVLKTHLDPLRVEMMLAKQ